jgi:APA family basic amino acid/polyamine antiporter
VPILAALICLGLMLYLPLITWVRFAIWLVLGVVIYFLYGVRHSRLAQEEIKEIGKDTMLEDSTATSSD